MNEYGNHTKFIGELNRLDFCDIELAILCVAQELEESKDEIHQASARKWRRLRDKVKEEIKRQDKTHGWEVEE